MQKPIDLVLLLKWGAIDLRLMLDFRFVYTFI
jgi:hypothetical protein